MPLRLHFPLEFKLVAKFNDAPAQKKLRALNVAKDVKVEKPQRGTKRKRSKSDLKKSSQPTKKMKAEPKAAPKKKKRKKKKAKRAKPK